VLLVFVIILKHVVFLCFAFFFFLFVCFLVYAFLLLLLLFFLHFLCEECIHGYFEILVLRQIPKGLTKKFIYHVL
jgi:hypothetical protein